MLPQLIPLCSASLSPSVSISVSISATAAIGQTCEKAPPELFNPHLEGIASGLLQIVQRDVPQWQMPGFMQLLRNSCRTLNLLRQKTPLGQHWGALIGRLPPDCQQRLVKSYGLST